MKATERRRTNPVKINPYKMKIKNVKSDCPRGKYELLLASYSVDIVTESNIFQTLSSTENYK